jgi:hypothetical protein
VIEPAATFPSAGKSHGRQLATLGGLEIPQCHRWNKARSISPTYISISDRTVALCREDFTREKDIIWLISAALSGANNG